MLVTIDQAGYDRDFFRLSTEVKDFTFYTFNYPKKIKSFLSHWTLIGVKMGPNPYSPITFIITNVEAEELNSAQYKVPDMSPPYIAFDRSEFQEILRFFRSYLEKEAKIDKLQFFLSLSIHEAIEFGLDPRKGAYREGYYQYSLVKHAYDTDLVSIVSFPQWEGPTPDSQRASLSFRTFSKDRLLDPLFRPLHAKNVSRISLSQEALGEFVYLLSIYW